ncbi:hypothetical protein [Bifidobacterium pseudolongum]|uniref:hypothetical protein n=1 Tax=Bifidobacterium pseudolongum TaxID=1694 RepID=UPI001021932C|nr:hypothetical protein [Bifidobacterium pseudolongum]RYQ67040.1 hypothetical protein PG2109B_1083 [Bifidobacterium pseudolongum subsp. globosum]
MTTTCDLSVDWNECPNCDLLKERIEVADAATRAAEVRVDCAWNEYLEARNNGLAYFCSPQYRAYHARIDNLEQALAEAHAAQTADIGAWAASIHEHHRLHEARQQEAEDGEPAETEEMVAIRKDAAVDALVNIYGGHIDKWLEALRERTGAQTDADDDAGAAETDGTEDGYCGANVPLRAVEAINSLDDAGLCVAVDLIYAMLDDITDLLRLDPHRLDGYRTQLTKTVFRRSGHESTSPCQGRRQAHSEGA